MAALTEAALIESQKQFAQQCSEGGYTGGARPIFLPYVMSDSLIALQSPRSCPISTVQFHKLASTHKVIY